MTREMKELIDKYWDEDEHEKIVDLIMAVPTDEQDTEMLGQLVVAYNNLDRYEDAIELSMKLKPESIENPAWYYRMGYALEGKQDYDAAAENLLIGIELATKKGDYSRAQDCQEVYNRCLPYLSKSRKERSVQNEPLEIVWSEDDSEYKVIKGAVDLGYYGGFACHQIQVDFTEYNFAHRFSTIDERADSLKNYIREDMNHDEIAQGLTVFFNKRLQEMTEHIVELNQAFLALLIEEMCGCGYPFWEECASYVRQDKMPSCDEDELEDVIYTEDICDASAELLDRYEDTPMNGEVDDTPRVEKFIEQQFPMFDYKRMLKDVHSVVLVLGEREISVECMGEGEAGKLVCAACVDFRNDLSFYGWNNH